MNYDGYSKYDRQVAQSYDEDRQGEEHWQAEYEWLAGYARRERLGRVLDIPVGTGRLLSAMTSASAVVGVDISDDMLQVARDALAKAGLAEVELRKGDALHLPDADRAFDTVACFRLVHLLPPQLLVPLMQELARVCSGRILLQVYLSREPRRRWPPIAWLLGQLGRLRPQRKLPWSHIQSYPHTWQVFRHAFDQAGLAVRARHALCAYAGSTVEVIELSR